MRRKPKLSKEANDLIAILEGKKVNPETEKIKLPHGIKPLRDYDKLIQKRLK